MIVQSVVLVERDGSVVLVTLHRPERLNALDDEMRDRLDSLWRDLAQDATLRCVVLTGAGRGFCSGADVDAIAGPRTGRGDLDAELSFLPGRRLPIPVIAAVNGVCAGGGLHFVADADIVVAGESASFVDPHVSVGQVSGIEPASLALRVPLQHLAKFTLLGRDGTLSARDALAVGLITEVVADDALLHRARQIAASISAASPSAVRATRRVLRELSDELLRPAMVRGWSAVQEHWSHPDASEGPAAWLERRSPEWKEPR